jgi:hypothetical protein
MEHRAHCSKLAELRSKTDRQILVLVGKQLNTAATLAELPEERGRAEQLYVHAGQLLSLAQHAPREERCAIESRFHSVGSLFGRNRQIARCA